MAGSNHPTHSQTSTPTSRRTSTTTPSTRSTQSSTAPPITPSPLPSLRRRRGTLNLTPSPPPSDDTTAWEHSPTTTGPLADFARTPMYPPPYRPCPAPQPITAGHPRHPTASPSPTSWEHSPTTTGPLASFARTTLYPPPRAPHPLASDEHPPFPRRYNDTTDPSARPIPPAIPPRAPLNTTTHFRSAVPQRCFAETTRRPTAMDQAQAAVQAALDEQLGGVWAARYEELPPMEAEAEAGLRVRERNLWVGMARVPDWGVLGTVVPFPEVVGGGSEDEDAAEAVSVLELSEGERMRVEGEMAEVLAEGEGEDGDASNLDGAQESRAVRTSVDSWGLRRSVIGDLAGARRAEWEREDSSEDSECVLLPPPFPCPEKLPMYVQVLHNAGLEGLDDLPTMVMQNFMRQGRERDGERNRRIRAIRAKREELSETIMQRRSRRMRQSLDADAIQLLMREINLLWHYDVHHWPTLEPLDYELDGFPREREIPSLPCWLDEPEDWDFAFNWDAPFSTARRSSVLSLVSVAQDRPVSPRSTDPGFAQAAIERIEGTFKR